MKILNYICKVLETLLGKIELIQNWYSWYYKEILESFSEIISVKFRKKNEKNCRKTLKKYRKHFAQT